MNCIPVRATASQGHATNSCQRRPLRHRQTSPAPAGTPTTRRAACPEANTAEPAASRAAPVAVLMSWLVAEVGDADLAVDHGLCREPGDSGGTDMLPPHTSRDGSRSRLKRIAAVMRRFDHWSQALHSRTEWLICPTDVGADLLCSYFPLLARFGHLCQHRPGCMHPVLVAAVSTASVTHAVGAGTRTAVGTREGKSSGIGVVLGGFQVRVPPPGANQAVVGST
jgi:hypothetical protein